MNDYKLFFGRFARYKSPGLISAMLACLLWSRLSREFRGFKGGKSVLKKSRNYFLALMLWWCSGRSQTFQTSERATVCKISLARTDYHERPMSALVVVQPANGRRSEQFQWSWNSRQKFTLLISQGFVGCC